MKLKKPEEYKSNTLIAYVVLEENTLGYLFSNQCCLLMGIFRASVIKGATHERLASNIYLTDKHEQVCQSLRLATFSDFDEYRVVLPGDFDEVQAKYNDDSNTPRR